MPRKARVPVVPFGNVGDTVTADDGKQYVIIKVDGAKVWLKHPLIESQRTGKNQKLGPGRPRFGLMVGNPSDFHSDAAQESEMTGPQLKRDIIDLDVL